MMKVSVVVPSYNESGFIEGCIHSLLNNGFPEDEMEILIVDGMSTDGTRDKVLKLSYSHHNIRLIDNPEIKTPFAFNKGITESKGDYILIMSAHSSFSENYIKTLFECLENNKADVVGGTMLTIPRKENSMARALAKIVSNKFGVGNSKFRLGTDKVVSVDTVPFGLHRKSVFSEIGLFNEMLIRNQDYEFSRRIIRSGRKILLVPGAISYYYPRDNLKSLSRNSFQYGMWNILTIYITRDPQIAAIRHLIPLCFVSALLIPIILAIISIKFLVITGIILCLYLIGVFIFSLKARENGIRFCHLVAGFICHHFSYGFGSLFGLFKLGYLFRSR